MVIDLEEEASLKAGGKKLLEKRRLICKEGASGKWAMLPREQEGTGSSLAEVLFLSVRSTEREDEDL